MTPFFAFQTGRSKHYAFIEFDSARVAEIVAETMDNYLLMGHILKCRIVPKSEVHPELWIGADRRFKKVPMARVYRVSHNKVRFENQFLSGFLTERDAGRSVDEDGGREG